jgi:hypothetical protein
LLTACDSRIRPPSSVRHHVDEVDEQSKTIVTAVIALVLIVGSLGAAALTVAGFSPVKPLPQFRTDRSAPTHLFADSPQRVIDAYASAAASVAGMRLAERDDRVLLIDSRPTARIIGGDFGVAIRVTVTAVDTGGAVTVEAQNKTVGRTRLSTVIELERALRMAAKQVGITELT